MSRFNRVTIFFLNVAVMAVVVIYMKYQDDLKQEEIKYNFAVYSGLMKTNNSIIESRTNKINNLLAKIEATQSSTSTPATTRSLNVKKTTTSAIRLPAPNPTISLPAKPSRTTKTS